MRKEKLPVAFKKKWVKALLSGKYKQGKHSLKKTRKSEVRYCCLGVACEIAGAQVQVKREPGFIENGKYVKGISKIPKVLRGSSGIPEQLANMNDEGKRFKTIAKWIDKNL